MATKLAVGGEIKKNTMGEFQNIYFYIRYGPRGE